MLKLKGITKTYVTGEEKVEALKGINVEFRKSEFVSILGQSGCGKTTLLNIIGGLDRYTKGDLIINGKSTKDFKDKDWDSYRNYSVGFVFQSYNLISHQSVLSNVELALTISGYSKQEKRQKAIEALEKVGLKDQIHKKPNQLSGGQMQRVAIARAIVNNPDIILADEPTGALDSKTSVQIMDVLKTLAKDKLIIMVTHNSDLAETYSDRIINLLDGKIISDSNPYVQKIEGKQIEKGKTVNAYNKKTKMKFSTALHLSLNNLMTKKGRTILTAFAGSIGIIGIALILSLSSGVQNYINNLQKETMVSYPISIEKESMDLSSMLDSVATKNDAKDINHDNDAVYSDVSSIESASEISTSTVKNNLTAFKEYLDDENSDIAQYLGENGVVYSYDTKFAVYSYDVDDVLINADGSNFEDESETEMGTDLFSDTSSIFEEILSSDDSTISTAITDSYEVIYGEMPEEYNEVVLVVDENNEISATTLYNLGLLPSSEYEEILEKLDEGEEITVDTQKLSYEDILNQTLYLIPACDYYILNENGLYEYVGDDETQVEDLMENAIELKITGIIKENEDSESSLISGTIGYTKKLTDYLIEYTNDSDVVKAQEENPDINVVNGMKFEVSTDEEKAEDAKEYVANLGVSEKAKLATSIMESVGTVMTMSETELATMFDQYMETAEQDVLVSIYDSYVSSGDYDENMENFGKVDYDSPSAINIYADTFENKDAIIDCIDNYNAEASEENQITYTDYVGLLMSSVTTIVNTISYVLIAFVAISLVVSSIMIAIITYISVLERTKEIGILRAMGTSKKDVSKIFNAETFIEGSIAGLLGIGVTLLLNIPINLIVKNLTSIETISELPLIYAIILIFISIILTVIAGLIPSKLAAKKDPAEVLRTE